MNSDSVLKPLSWFEFKDILLVRPSCYVCSGIWTLDCQFCPSVTSTNAVNLLKVKAVSSPWRHHGNNNITTTSSASTFFSEKKTFLTSEVKFDQKILGLKKVTSSNFSSQEKNQHRWKNKTTWPLSLLLTEHTTATRNIISKKSRNVTIKVQGHKILVLELHC